MGTYFLKLLNGGHLGVTDLGWGGGARATPPHSYTTDYKYPLLLLLHIHIYYILLRIELLTYYSVFLFETSSVRCICRAVAGGGGGGGGMKDEG